MFLPLSLREHLPGGVACLPIGQHLPVNLDIIWRPPAHPATRALVETDCQLARAEGWIPAR
ncbi:hypothetical protein [Saccharopolyspora sp. 5N708]|uniref:hypothetical protein n=1 Tax=Saccharopolyspora sp. 5N708 TaxID=3457424 RepID=UPI003FD47C9F